jgi:hypothetical protein
MRPAPSQAERYVPAHVRKERDPRRLDQEGQNKLDVAAARVGAARIHDKHRRLLGAERCGAMRRGAVRRECRSISSSLSLSTEAEHDTPEPVHVPWYVYLRTPSLRKRAPVLKGKATPVLSSALVTRHRAGAVAAGDDGRSAERPASVRKAAL